MFIPLLTDVADEIEIEYDGLGLIASFIVAESIDSSRIVTVQCELSPIDEYGDNAYEFAFSISCVAFDGSELPVLTQDREIASAFIPDASREFIMPSVCTALRKLLQFALPPVVYRVLKFPGLPQKALLKHHMITDTLLEMSYRMDDEGTDQFNRPFFVMVLDK